jgi:SanA protein
MKKIIKAILLLLVLIIPASVTINGYVVGKTNDYILKNIAGEISVSDDELAELKSLDADCIMVLGAGLKPDGTPNHMLADRLDVGIALYKAGVAPKLLFTGDHGQKQYDEVNAMKAYGIAVGIPAEDIFLDHAGFSTYESMFRADAIFEVKTMIIVTQEYHQYRALYSALGFGIDAYGVASDQRLYSGQTARNIRELLARNKDFLKMIYKPLPTYLGDSIPISGSGLTSHD